MIPHTYWVVSPAWFSVIYGKYWRQNWQCILDRSLFSPSFSLFQSFVIIACVIVLVFLCSVQTYWFFTGSCLLAWIARVTIRSPTALRRGGERFRYFQAQTIWHIKQINSRKRLNKIKLKNIPNTKKLKDMRLRPYWKYYLLTLN